jgi:tRNA pseudouridine55 synthase
VREEPSPQPSPASGRGGKTAHAESSSGYSSLSRLRERAGVRAERAPRRPLHGVLLLNKPLGWTSNDALQKVKGMLRAEKAGHTGTLDPLATGLLPLCFGAATKFSQASLDADKRYTATLTLGVTTDSGDREGAVTATAPVQVDEAAIHAACARFVGPIAQLPPMHSALKHQGRKLYELAREGKSVEREPRQVHIHGIELLRWQGAELVLDVHCSKGTYIRTLAEDIGRALGCGAHLAALVRTQSGALHLADAIGIEALQALDDEARLARLLPPQALLGERPTVRLDADDAGRFLTGLRRRVNHPDADAVSVFGPEPRAFLGTAHIIAGELIPDRLLSPLEVQGLP